jgi:hypothetical protein
MEFPQWHISDYEWYFELKEQDFYIKALEVKKYTTMWD